MDGPRSESAALDAVARGPWGRIACMDACLPASLASNAGLYDVRGYDGADPIRSMQLLDLFRAPGSTSLPHAHAQIFVPKIPSPLADLLGIRWIIARGSAPPDVPTVASSPDYFVVENPRALPRAFVPRGIETVADPRARLARLAAAEFDPRAVALLEVDVPPLAAPAEGDAEVAPTDDSDRLRITARMKTPGALVVSDSWDPGWRAFVGGVERPILRVDHALRAVLLPAGEWTVEMRYEPESFFVGSVVAGGASIALALVALLARRPREPCRHARVDPQDRDAE